MTSAIVVGSGIAAAGAMLALSRDPTTRITVLDVGVQLESDAKRALATLGSASEEEWSTELVSAISRRAVPTRLRGLPEKRSYGSDFPFRDVGQIAGLTASRDMSSSLVTGAYGGFSTVWGAQVTPFTPTEFASWPIDMAVMKPHYRAVLDGIPYAGERDDLAEVLPLIGSPQPLPPPSPRTTRVLTAYARHRRRLNRMGVTLGKARLALNARGCTLCGLCMTGCPHSLIYSAYQTVESLRASGRVTYHGDLLVVRLAEDGDTTVVTAKDVRTGQIHRFTADRTFVACGAFGTTRLVAGSLQLFDCDIEIGESQQFTLPMLSLHGTPDPRKRRDFTLNQFNMVLGLANDRREISQVHFYTYDPAFIDALPGVLRTRAGEPLQRKLLERLSVAIGYLPSWRSPRIRMRLAGASADELPRAALSRDEPRWLHNDTFLTILKKLLQASPYLDLYPVLPKLLLAAGGKSYHWGGSFPHSSNPRAPLGTDRVGRLAPWQRIHLVDASVFPDIPATTYGLTVMANAHRIASEAGNLS